MARLVRAVVFCLCLGLCAAVTVQLNQRLQQRPVQVKLGYTPHETALKTLSGEHRYSVGQLLTLKVIIYFGGLVEQWKQQVQIKPELQHMYRTLLKAVQLDPYNMDAYYFAQANFTWEVGQVEAVNSMLRYGMRHRDWDWYLPFFLGFNHAYFLKNPAKAAAYMQQAAKLSGSKLQAQLASRYFYEADRETAAITFLKQMLSQAGSRQEQQLYRLRLQALQRVKQLKAALEAYRQQQGQVPESLAALVQAGFLERIPPDPYGGRFYLDDQGKVRSSSRFSANYMEKQHESQ